MKCVDCKFHKAFPTTNIHWCEATKKHRRISDEDVYVDAPCKVADRKTENCSEIPNNCKTEPQIYGNEYNCIMTLFGDCSYAETGCGSCEVVEKVRKALDKYEPKDEPQTERSSE